MTFVVEPLSEEALDFVKATAHRSHAAEGHTWCNDTLQPRPDVMNLDEPEMLSRLEEQVDRYLAARDVLAERLLALRPRAEGGS